MKDVHFIYKICIIARIPFQHTHTQTGTHTHRYTNIHVHIETFSNTKKGQLVIITLNLM